MTDTRTDMTQNRSDEEIAPALIYKATQDPRMRYFIDTMRKMGFKGDEDSGGSRRDNCHVLIYPNYMNGDAEFMIEVRVGEQTATFAGFFHHGLIIGLNRQRTEC